MVIPLNELLSALKTTYSTISFLESDEKTTGRYREKQIIVFEYTNIAGDRCVLKYFSLQHIEESQKARERDELLEEFRTIKKFGNTPHVVQVYDANDLRLDGRLVGLYITMEKFDATLADLIKTNKMVKPSLVDDFLSQMDQILYMAHYQLKEPVIHSDIKPGNIGVRNIAGGKLQYALMDFDISVVLKIVADGTLMLSNKAGIRGITPAYAPPEQVMAYLHNSGNISNRVDIYAIGAIAMQMLTGIAPEKDTSKIYYQLPFNKLNGKWKTVFSHMCNPDPSRRPKRIMDAFNMAPIEAPNDGTVTIKINSKYKQFENINIPDTNKIKAIVNEKIIYINKIIISISKSYLNVVYALIILAVTFMLYLGVSHLTKTNVGTTVNGNVESDGIVNSNPIISNDNLVLNPPLSSSSDLTNSNNAEALQDINQTNVDPNTRSEQPKESSQKSNRSTITASISLVISPSNATVLLRDSDDNVVVQTIGSASINNIEFGDYTVRVAAEGYITTFEGITINESGSFQRRITLRAIPATSPQPAAEVRSTTPSDDCGGDARDVDGNRYTVISLGSQCWMGTNLRVRRYRDGTLIPRISNDTYWSGSTTGAWSHYENSASYESVHGVLYNWYTVTDSRGLCPAGWRVPSTGDWSTLATSLSNNSGGKLKATRLWRSPNVGADNVTQFSAMPSGTRSSAGTFADLGTSTGYWTSNQTSESSATLRFLTYNLASISTLNQPKNSGFSIRCIKI